MLRATAENRSSSLQRTEIQARKYKMGKMFLMTVRTWNQSRKEKLRNEAEWSLERWALGCWRVLSPTYGGENQTIYRQPAKTLTPVNTTKHKICTSDYGVWLTNFFVMLSEAVHLNVANYTWRRLMFIAEIFTGVDQQTNKQITPQKLFYCKLITVMQHLSGKAVFLPNKIWKYVFKIIDDISLGIAPPI